MKSKHNIKLAFIMIVFLMPIIVLASDPNSPTFTGSDAYPDIMNVGQQGLFTATYESKPDTDVTMYVCRESSCLNCGVFPDKSGCFCYNEAAENDGEINCTYTPTSSDTESTYYIKLMNVTNGTNKQTDGNIGTDAATFDINHRPIPTSVYISYNTANPTNQSTLYCNYTFSDPDGDSEQDSSFKWMVQDNGTGPFAIAPGITENTLLPTYFNKLDRVICTVNVTDEHSLESSPGVNSSAINITNSAPTIQGAITIINNSPNAFLNWTATFTDIDTDIVRVTKVRWYRNNAYAPVFDNMNISPASTTLGQTWKVEIHYQDDAGMNGSAANSSTITIQEGGPTLYYINTSSDFENSTFAGNNATFTINWTADNYGSTTVNIFICNQSGANAAGCPFGSKTYCSLTEAQISPTLCNYTMKQTDRFILPFFGIICENSTICTSEYTGQFYRFNDTTYPNMSVSLDWKNISANTTFKLIFNLSDNFNVSAQNLLLNISNRTNSTYHTALNSTWSGANWIMGQNISCWGNITNQECSVYINMSNGHYNATFWVNDSYGNIYTRTYKFTIDSIVPDIENAGNGYVNAGGTYIISDFAPTKHIFANWSNISGTLSGINHYEYALGKGEIFGQQDWNSLVNWTDVGLATHVNFTASMFAGESYFFHLRAINNGGAISNVTTTGGLIFEDNSPPVCVLVYDYGPHSNNWTNSDNSLTAWWNFSEEDTEIEEYEIAIGNATPPIQGNPPLLGFENVLPRTSTALTTFSSSSLTLVENRTYYFSVRAKNQYNTWSSWCYSDGITVDTHLPRNGSIIYPSGFVAYTNITILANPGVDDFSGIDLNNDVRLLVASAPISPIDYNCPAFSAFTPAPQSAPYNPMGTLFNTTPGYCYKFRLAVTDRAGNEKTYYSMIESEDDYTVVSDTTPPLSFNVYDTGHKTYIGTQLEANWTFSADPETGISQYTYSIWKKSKVNGSMILEYPWVNVSASTNHVIRTGLSLEDESQYYFYVKAVNRVGIETTAMVSNGIIYADLSPPGPITFQAVENNTYVLGRYFDTLNDGNTTLRAYSTDIDLGRCVYSETDTGYYEKADSTNICNITDFGGDRNITCNVTDSSEGIKEFFIYCRDESGNNQFNGQAAGIPLAVSWVNDWNPPVITINFPINNEIVGGLVDIDTDILDAGIGEISQASLQIINWSGSIVENATLSSPYNYTWDAIGGSYNGTYKLVITANDTFGRESTKSVNFTIDNGRPWIDIKKDNYVNSSFTVKVIAQLFTNMSYSIYNSTGSLILFNSSNFTQMKNYHEMNDIINITNQTKWLEGEYLIYAEAIDNISQNANMTEYFTIDRKSPLLINMSNTTDYYTNEFIEFNVTVTDANPIAEVDFMLNITGRWVNYTWTNGSISNNLTKTGSMFRLTYQIPVNRNNKTHAWRIKARDRAGNINDSGLLNLNVLNTWPVFQGPDSDIDFGEDQTHVETMPYYDLDQDNLTFIATNSTNIFIIYINHTGKQVWFRSTPDWYGQENITINATDPYGGWNFTEFNVTIFNIDDPPTLNISNQMPNLSFMEDGYNDSINISEHFYDVDNTTLSFGYESPGLPPEITVNITNGIINVSGSNDYFGVFQLNVTATDGIYTTKSNAISVTITNINDPPELGPVQDYTINETLALIITFNATDIDSTSFNVSVNDTRFNKQADNLTFIWQTNITDSGNYSFNVTVKDAEGLSVSQIFNVHVINMSDFDGDGIADPYDSDMDGDSINDIGDLIIGNVSHTQTNIPNLDLLIDGISGLNSITSGLHTIKLVNNSPTNISNVFMDSEFMFNMTHKLDLRNSRIFLLNSSINTPLLTLSGWNIMNKTLYLHPWNYSINSVCIKDNETFGINESQVTSLCNATDEQLVTCDSSPYGNYRCDNRSDANGSAFIIFGLQHSLVKQQDGCTDHDGDGYGAGNLCSGTDPDDTDNSIYTGAPCSFNPCYYGSTINANGVCSGGTNNCGGGGSSSSGGGYLPVTSQEEECTEVWSCTIYSDCDSSGFQTRSCHDINNCGTHLHPENTKRQCTYHPQVLEHESCDDGVQNQGETQIDCGGPCPSCPTCSDGFQNQGESGIDCGGPCGACLSTENPSQIIVEDKFKKWLIPTVILLLATALTAFFMYRWSESFQKKKTEDLLVKEEAGTLLYYRKFKQKVFDKLVELRIYMKKQLSLGKKPEEIKKELLGMGWKETIVEESFLLNKLVSLELYVKKELENGVSKEKIKSDTLASGWHESNIDDVFMLNTLIQVELYIRKKIQQGIDPDDLKLSLMHVGWKKETVDELFELNILLDLEIYLDKQLSMGMDEKQITEKLISLGWSKDVVDEAILFCKLTL